MNIDIISPVKKPEDIKIISEQTNCRNYYVYYHKFLNGKLSYINEFLDKARNYGCHLYLNFKHDIKEENLKEVYDILKYIKNTDIDGLFVNNFAVLEELKNFKFPFKVIADSYFEIHNLSGIDFINNFHKIDGVLITEEIYLRNILKIKQYTNLSLAIDSDNLPWCIKDVEDLIDCVVIKGKFETSGDILNGVKQIEEIIENPECKTKKLNFKHVRNSIYEANHFSGDMVSAVGKNFKFSKNIEPFNWNIKRAKLKTNNLKKPDNYKINLRLSSLDQFKKLDEFHKKIGFKLVDSIEYGEILSTSDLAKRDFNTLVKKAQIFCKNRNIKFQLSTPRILIERDFDRVYDYEKSICLEMSPDTLIINNIGYFWAVIHDLDMININIEIGQGINLLNSMSIKFLNEINPIKTIDFTNFPNVKTAEKIKNIIENKKYTIAGNIRIPTIGLCPLNKASAVNSRLSCKAPCHNGQFALKDPALNKHYPFITDGFCRMHMFDDKVVEHYDRINELLKVGINEFVFDFSSLDSKFVPVLLTNFLNYTNI